jgi:hypothetical protein
MLTTVTHDHPPHRCACASWSDRSCGNEAQPAARHVALRQDLFHDAAHQIDGIAKPMPSGPPYCTVQHRGVDADQIALRIDERAAGVAEIDGGVGLNEILESRQSQLAAAGGADDALRHGLADPVGIADGEHDIAHPQRVGAAHRHDSAGCRSSNRDGDVGVGVLNRRWSRRRCGRQPAAPGSNRRRRSHDDW